MRIDFSSRVTKWILSFWIIDAIFYCFFEFGAFIAGQMGDFEGFDALTTIFNAPISLVHWLFYGHFVWPSPFFGTYVIISRVLASLILHGFFGFLVGKYLIKKDWPWWKTIPIALLSIISVIVATFGVLWLLA